MKNAKIFLVMLFFIVSACSSAQFVEITPMPETTATPTKSPTATSTATKTPTVEPTVTDVPTATTVLTHDIHVQIWHDYNGDGNWDDEEPALADVTPTLKDILSGEIYSSCKTDVDGKCTMEGVPNQGDGMYRVIVDAPEQFNWILPDVWSGIEIEKGLDVSLASKSVSIPLANGTSDGIGLVPIPKGFEYWIGTWYDQDKSDGSVKNWLGQIANSGPFTSGHWPIDTQDGHYAIDYFFDIQTPIVASDACEIIRMEQDKGQADPKDHVILCQSINSAVVFDYGHVNPIDGISVGAKLFRGQLIGYSSKGQDPSVSNFLAHLGIAPLGCHAYSCSVDPYPNFWTTDDFDLARVYIEE